MAAPDTRRVDQHLQRAADQLVPPVRGDGVLQLAELAQPVGHEPGRHRPVEAGGVRADLGAVGEEPAPVDLRLLDEPQQLVVVALGLTGVADDEVAAEGGLRLAGADVGDAAQEAVAVTPPPHAAQQGLADVLQGEIEVGHSAVADGVDQRVGEIARVEVQQAHAVDAIGHGAHERHDGPGAELAGDVLAVRGEILGDEHDLPGAERIDLAEDRGHRPAALRAAERRDGAEPALAVAALGDLDVGPWCLGRRAGQLEQIHRRQVGGGHRDQRPVAGRLVEADPEPGDLVDLGEGGGQLVAVALGHAAGDDESGAGPALLAEGEHGVDRLAAGGVDEGARVDDDQVGGARLGRGDHPVVDERADELVGVDLVLGTAQRLDVEAGHVGRIYWPSGNSIAATGTS